MSDTSESVNALHSKLDPTSEKARANIAGLLALLRTMRAEEARIRDGGGAKAAEAQRAKRRLTVRERLALLLDPEPLQLGSVAVPPFARSAKDGATRSTAVGDAGLSTALRSR